jgi:hypothetical protein
MSKISPPTLFLFVLLGITIGFSAQTAALSQPDLKAEDLSGDWEAHPGESINFSFSVENIGDAASESCYWSVYISPGAYYVGSRIGSGTIYALDPGTSDRLGGSGEIPSDMLPGYYYLYAVADDGDYVSDADRSNNVAWMRFQVLEADPQAD